MDDQRDTAPLPGTDADPPASRGTVRGVLGATVVGVVLAATAALVAPAVLDGAAADPAHAPSPAPSATTPAAGTGDPTRWVEDTTALLLALPGVADVQMNGLAGASAEITLETPLPSPEVAQRTADAARELLVASRGGAIWSLRVGGTTATGATLLVADGTDARGTRGAVESTGEPLPDLLGHEPVAFATRLLADDGVRGVGLEPSYAAVDVVDAASLVPVAVAFRDAGRPLSALSTSGYGVSLSLGDAATVPDDALLALVGDTAAQPGVVNVLYEARRPVLPGTPLLTVTTSGDPAPVAHALEESGFDGPPLAYQVHGTTDVRSGYVAGSAPGVPADGTTCATDHLALGLTGFDAALGRRFLTVTARNDDDAPCVLAGSPALRFVASDGGEQEVLVEPDANATGNPVTLAPGDSAHAMLSWRGGSTAGGPPLVTSVLAAPTPGTTETVLPLAGVTGTENGLDLLDGSTATISPWAPARSTSG